jgi:hypothetical protein
MDMSSYPVTVTASYVAAGAPDDTIERLSAWVAGADGRTFTVDESIAPVRWTVTVDYVVGADSDLAAERLAVERYTHETRQERFPEAETVVADTGSLR